MECKKIKVLHLLPSNQFSGAENVVCQIIEMLRDEEAYSMVYCSPDGPIRSALAERAVDFIPMEDFSYRSVRNAISEYWPHVIHAHDVRACVMAVLCAGRIPVVFHIHNNWFGAKRLDLKSLMLMLASFKARHIFWVSSSALTCYPCRKIVHRKSSVLMNIINVENLVERMQQDKQSYDYDIVYIGRLTYQKNPQRLLTVLGKIAARKKDVKMAVIGSGELREEMERLVHEKDLDDNVHFLGFQSNPYKMLGDAKLMLMTSRWEGTPISVLEAMALGVPVVSTPTDGICDLIESGKNGYLSNDDEKLAEYALALLNNRYLWDNLHSIQLHKGLAVNDIMKYKNKIVLCYVEKNR